MILKNKIVFLVIVLSLSILTFLYIKRGINNNAYSQVLIKEQVINVGNVNPKEGLIKVNFELLNEGGKNLIISNVKTSCSCTAPTWPKNPIELNKKAVISVEYHGESVGYFQEDILVYCNAQYSPLLLTLEGEIVNNVN